MIRTVRSRILNRSSAAFLLTLLISVGSVYGAFLTYKAVGEIWGRKKPLGQVELDLMPIPLIEGTEARENFIGRMRVYTLSNNTEVIVQLTEVSRIVLNFRSFVLKMFRPLDVIFIVDVSGTMAPFMSTMKEQLTDLVDVLSVMTKAPVRFGVVAFKDYFNETSQLYLTPDITRVKGFIGNLTAFNGGGIPQSHYLGFRAALNDFLANSTRNEAKLEIFVSDTEAGMDDSPSFEEAEVAAELTAERGIRIYSVLAGPEEEPERSQLEYYADVSDGKFVAGAERIVSVTTSDPYWIVKLTPVTPFDSFLLKLDNPDGYVFDIWVDFYAKAVRWEDIFLVELLANLEKAEVKPKIAIVPKGG